MASGTIRSEEQEDRRKCAYFFGAHPDDVELFALGTLLQLQRCGWEIGWVIATDGSRAEGHRDLRMAKVRKAEAFGAAEMCDARCIWLDFPDGELAEQTAASAKVGSVLRDLSPDLIITHHPRDYHTDHREIARLVGAAVRPTDAVLNAEPILGLGPAPDILIEVTEVFAAKREALLAHASQAPDPEILDRWNGFRALQMMLGPDARAEGFLLPDWTHARPDAVKRLPDELNIKRFG